MTGAEVVTVARSWIGTPYVHQASVRGAGTDCLGVLRGIWRHLFGEEPGDIPAYSLDWSEPQRDEVLWAALADALIGKDVDDEDVGDVILFRMRDRAVAKHVGVQSRIGADAAFVHAYRGHGVVETALGFPWRRRIVARFAFPFEQEE
ncbi:peptidase [Marivita sp. S0852]|uniref:peptidase n=1 Tax=Marivita sp. S0852 TaxID=3373893 RepID=UPI0039827238